MRHGDHLKSLNLGTELDITGRFLFNGLQAFHEMEHFAAEEDVFEFLHSMAAGIERLVKIAIILSDHCNDEDQEGVERSSPDDTLQELALRLRLPHGLKFAERENDFIALLSRFHMSQRDGPYAFHSALASVQERDELVNFLERHLNTKIDFSGLLTLTPNELKYRKFIGKVVSEIVNPIHQIVEDAARRLDIYTYEIDCQSKASKIFLSKKFDFDYEDILQAELMAYFLSIDACGQTTQSIRDLIKPLPFDPALEGEYLAPLRSNRNKIAVLDELVWHYEDIPSTERRALLTAVMPQILTYKRRHLGHRG